MGTHDLLRMQMRTKNDITSSFQTPYPLTIPWRGPDLWAYHKGVVLDFSRPGKPTDNSYIESFNGKLRVECLNAHWFMSLDDARAKMEVGVETIMSSGHTAKSAAKCRFRS